MPRSKLLDRRLMELLAAAGRPIGLGPHRYYFMVVINEPSQGRHGRFRSAHENYAHKLQGRGLAPPVPFQKSGQAAGQAPQTSTYAAVQTAVPASARFRVAPTFSDESFACVKSMR